LLQHCCKACAAARTCSWLLVIITVALCFLLFCVIIIMHAVEHTAEHSCAWSGLQAPEATAILKGYILGLVGWAGKQHLLLLLVVRVRALHS
jgi:hypothetical protein